MADMTRINMRVRGAEVVRVPIDDTLTIEGQAADAKAVGDALAQKADKSELQAKVKVNYQEADAQGLILIDGTNIPVSTEDTDTLAEVVGGLKTRTAAEIPMSSAEDAKTIAEEFTEVQEAIKANTEAIENMEEMTAANILMESGSTTTVKNAIESLDRKTVKSVNRKTPDEDGDVDLTVVPLAENLQSDKMENVEGSFIIRTTGGNSSVSDGKAYPQHIMGTMERTGYVAEVLEMTVIPITRTPPDEPITATIDRDTFVAYVDESGTINLYYTTEWSEDPELYGVTVTGDPVAGDQIKIEYTKEGRGTITVADPEKLVGTGWNLFNYNQGYARVVKYSDEYGYKIGGTYTSVAFSTTLTGERSSITPSTNGLFNVPGDGYVFVTGGNNTDTYILATWSDWQDGPATGYWEAYRESSIDLSAVVETYFQNGMCSIGNVRDEIDLSAKRTISRIERMAYSEENRAAAAATGREYTFDENYVYLEKADYVISAIVIDTEYTVSEHGMEWFEGTSEPLGTEILYGKNLRDKLERDVLTISEQTLTAEEQAQVRRNIGVMDPPTNGNGTNGQLLQTNGDGTTKWTTQGTPTDAQVGTAVNAWLTNHPEATTTVQDGAISRAKLNNDLKAKTDIVPVIAGSEFEVGKATNTGTGSTFWYNFPTEIKNKINENRYFYIRLLSATGLGTNYTPIADLYVYYTDSTSTRQIIQNITDDYYLISIDSGKTINAISIKFKRGTVSESTETEIDYIILYSDKYIGMSILDLQKHASETDEKFYNRDVLDKAELDQDVLYNRKETQTGTDATMWVSDSNLPSNPQTNELYVYIYDYSGASIPANATDLVRLNVVYTDTTAVNFDFSKKKTWTKKKLDANKTVDHIGVRFRRSSATLGVAEETSYHIVITDTFPIAPHLDDLDYTAKEPITDSIINRDNVMISGFSDSFTAVSSATWQSPTSIEMIAPVPEGITNLWYLWDDANTYGTSSISNTFYSDEACTQFISSYTLGYNTLNNNKKYNVPIPEGAKAIKMYVCLISSTFGQYVPEAGDVAFVKNLRAYFGVLSLREDLDVPQVSSLDQATLYTLRSDWVNRIQDMQELQKEHFICGIQSDTHFGKIGTGIYKTQYKDLMVNLSKLTEYVGFNFIANLGDIIRGYTGDTTAKMKEAFTELMHRYVSHLKCQIFLTPGNHDTNVIYATEEEDPTLQITKEEIYAKIMPFIKNSGSIVENGKSLYYYKDFDQFGIRVIVLNTTDGVYDNPEVMGSTFVISSEQVQWFAETALNTDKAVLLMTHVPLVDGLTTNVVTNGTDVITALEEFKTNGGTVIGCFYGHTHSQSNKTQNGIPHITFTQGGFAAEIVVIDTTNKTIKTIGLGESGDGTQLTDREFSYQ